MTTLKNNKNKNSFFYKYKIYIGIIVVFSLATIISLTFYFKKKNKDSFKSTKKPNKNNPEYYKFSEHGLRNLVDEKGNICSVILIVYPFTDKKKYENYLEAKSRGAKFIGCSSYINFPCITKNKYDITIINLDGTTEKYQNKNTKKNKKINLEKCLID